MSAVHDTAMDSTMLRNDTLGAMLLGVVIFLGLSETELSQWWAGGPAAQPSTR
jgi:hypothetical protein